MPKNSVKYTKAMLEDAVRTSYTIADVMRKLGIRQAGGSHAHIRRRIAELRIDISHFRGREWNTGGKQTGGPEKRLASQILTLRDSQSPPERTQFLRRALLEIGREYACVECGLGALWNDRPLVLQIDHINGNHYDNRPENLRFMCANCHSQTANYSRRK